MTEYINYVYVQVIAMVPLTPLALQLCKKYDNIMASTVP